MKFSVIIPLYNKAPYVTNAIKSVLSQTYDDYELIVMDDGSKDSSYDVASQAIGGHCNCHIYRQQNAGVSMARNNAVAQSNGDYLCFLDADDWWEPAFLEEMARFVDEFPEAGIFGTNYTIVNESKHKTRIAPIGVDAGFEKGYINYCQVYAKDFGMPLWTGAVCIPQKVYLEMGGFPKGVALGEDFLLWIRIALKYKVAFLNKALANYNQDSAPEWRGVSQMREPKQHMLWNLGYLEDEERKNQDLKRLLDRLRTQGLLPYYLSKRYREETRGELAKIDWNCQPEKTRKLYSTPIILLRLRMTILSCGSKIKNLITRHS